MQEVAEASQEAILGDEGAGCLPPEDGVDGRMVVKVQMQGQCVTLGGKGQGLDGGE